MGKRKLRIVDNSERFLSTTETLLQKKGVEVVTASNNEPFHQRERLN